MPGWFEAMGIFLFFGGEGVSDRFPPGMVLSRQVPHRYRMETIVPLFNRDLSSSHLFHSPKYHQVWHPFKLFSRDTYIAPPSAAAETEIHCLLLMNPIQVNTRQLQDIVLRIISVLVRAVVR